MSKITVLLGLGILLAAVITAIVSLTTQGSRDDSSTVDEDGGDGFQDDLPRRSPGGTHYVTPKMLVCTFGNLGVLSVMVPPDGVCDVIFYEEVFYDPKMKIIRPTHSAMSFHVLQSLNVTYTMTTFGTSMATGAIVQSVHNDKADVMAAMEPLFASGMVHFGMLNVADFENYNKDGSLLYLEVVDEFQKSKGDSKGHCALGVSLNDGTQGKVILEKAKEATVDFLGITMVIIKLHAGKVASAADLWPVGPNPDGADLNNYKILTLVCKLNREKTQSDDVTNYSYDARDKFLAMFDDTETFKNKTEERAKLLPDIHGGIAAYKVEADDFVGFCDGGEKFARLKAIRDALK
ncbi:hypothetical protein HPB52_002973 [Rhipicephalus sanguineus]|uniref:Uncharacterized protein n=1 Tax=Rhipicephalus sanguineus TaxID=34632 RepID=A0A9D4QA14_RHISA|nr:hypothetical protein HPB52_002973 [Rhipicephalus sanguineus]